MKLRSIFAVAMLMACSAATEPAETPTESDSVESAPLEMPETAQETTAETTTIRGIAHDRKGGAVVHTDSVDYWMEDLSFWEDQYRDQEVVVTGTIEARDDNPVVSNESEEISQGIPVDPEQLDNMKTRYWIINATVQLAQQ